MADILLDIGAERVSQVNTNPLPTVPRDFWETEAMSYEADRSTQASDSRYRAEWSAYERAADELRRFGPMGPNPSADPDSNEGTVMGGGAQGSRLREAWQKRIEQLQAERPEEAESLGRFLPDAIEKDARERAVTANRDYETLGQVQGMSLAGTIGGARAMIRDPLNIITAPIGAGTGGAAASMGLRILRSAVIESFVGGASSLAIDASAAPFRVQAGMPAGVGENLLMGMLGGAVIGGGVRGIHEGWRAFRQVTPARDGAVALQESDAATVLESHSRDLSSNPRGPEVAETHLDLLDKATEAVSAGRFASDAMPPPAARADVAGTEFRIHTPAGRSIAAETQVVELRDLIPSHTDEMALNPAYPHAEGVQPRDRSRDASQAQIQDIAANLEPERLRSAPEAGSGAPIVDAENVVESGNGRVLAIRRAYSDPSLAERVTAYRSMMEAQGHDLTGMSQPVLVSRRVSALSPDERRAFVREANSSTALTMGAAERARLDADMAGRALDLYRGGDIALADNAGFVRAFMQGVPQAERGAMTAGDGTLSGEGARRIRGAVLARAYGDEMGPLLERILEGDAEGLRSIAGALQDVSGPWAAMRAASARGELAPGMDVTADLLSAVRTISLAREKRIPVADLLAQTDLDAPPLSDAGRALLASMYRDNGFRAAAGRSSVSARLTGYVDEAMKTTSEVDMFGTPPARPTQILDATDPMRGRQQAVVASAERTAEIQAQPKAQDATFLEAQRIAGQRDVQIPVDDAGTTRGLRELLDEAEDAVADAAGAAACFIGATT